MNKVRDNNMKNKMQYKKESNAQDNSNEVSKERMARNNNTQVLKETNQATNTLVSFIANCEEAFDSQMQQCLICMCKE